MEFCSLHCRVLFSICHQVLRLYLSSSSWFSLYLFFFVRSLYFWTRIYLEIVLAMWSCCRIKDKLIGIRFPFVHARSYYYLQFGWLWARHILYIKYFHILFVPPICVCNTMRVITLKIYLHLFTRYYLISLVSVFSHVRYWNIWAVIN